VTVAVGAVSKAIDPHVGQSFAYRCGDAAALAETALARLVEPMAKSEREITVCLTGGTTPKHMYAVMEQSPWRERIPWGRVHWFMGDDRFAPYGDPLSNSGVANRLFLDACFSYFLQLIPRAREGAMASRSPIHPETATRGAFSRFFTTNPRVRACGCKR
jgi:Glucosamine-6-phosphate isomerases/6-phosphogluconolactonase